MSSTTNTQGATRCKNPSMGHVSVCAGCDITCVFSWGGGLQVLKCPGSAYVYIYIYIYIHIYISIYTYPYQHSYVMYIVLHIHVCIDSSLNRSFDHPSIHIIDHSNKSSLTHPHPTNHYIIRYHTEASITQLNQYTTQLRIRIHHQTI